jgi:hypothetical protein
MSPPHCPPSLELVLGELELELPPSASPLPSRPSMMPPNGSPASLLPELELELLLDERVPESLALEELELDEELLPASRALLTLLDDELVPPSS